MLSVFILADYNLAVRGVHVIVTQVVHCMLVMRHLFNGSNVHHIIMQCNSRPLH